MPRYRREDRAMRPMYESLATIPRFALKCIAR